MIYPNHPPNWDTLPEPKQIDLINEILRINFPSHTKQQKKKVRKETIQVSWDNLEDEYKQLIPRGLEIISQTQSGKKSRFHFDQTLAYLKMSPENTTLAINIKNQTLDYIFDTIVKSIPLTVKLN